MVTETSLGYLPMFLITTAMIFWVIAPVVFGPLPKFNLMKQDSTEFGKFINSSDGMKESDIDDVIKRGANGKVRSLYECGLADELETWSERPKKVLTLFVFVRIVVTCFFITVLPADFYDFS